MECDRFVGIATEEDVIVPAFSLIIVTCGHKSCVERYLSDLINRAFASVRVVIISSTDASKALSMIQSCSSGSDHMGIVTGSQGRKTRLTHLSKYTTSAKSCMVFISNSSTLRLATYRLLRPFVEDRSISVIQFNEAIIKRASISHTRIPTLRCLCGGGARTLRNGRVVYTVCRSKHSDGLACYIVSSIFGKS